MIDQSLHALVADGKHGKNEAIQTFKCQACQTTFTSRRYTPLYRLKTPCSKVGQVLMAMAEGVDLSAAERIFGHRSTTIATWLCRAGQHGQLLHHQTFLNLPLPHLQLDEIRTRLRCRSQVLWLWLAIDPLTKLVPALLLGARSQNAAYTLVHSLKSVLAQGMVPIFTSDGLNFYYYAITSHFGHWTQKPGCKSHYYHWEVDQQLLYGQVKKSYKRYRLARVTQLMRCGRSRFSKALYIN
jgi:IS1 family transposase